MLYLAIDQHRKQLTVNLRNEAGDVLLQRQVSTEWQRMHQFFEDLRRKCSANEGFVAIVEVCAFNDWLIRLLREYGCQEVVLVQAEKRSKQKTDRRDANQLGEMLWVNRHRLLGGKRVHQLRRVMIPSAEVAADRQVTNLRKRLVDLRTRTINKVQRILLKHNRQQDCPTKGIQTRKARLWLAKLELPEIDRLEMNTLLTQWSLWDQQIGELERVITERQGVNETAVLLATIPGASAFSSLALAARLGEVNRFPRGDSLANFWGLTPGCRNSGDATQRLGSITKQGSPMARFLLAQMVLHALRKDAWLRQWYREVKRRRGSKIARVGVMRRLATIIWNMVQSKQPYCCGGPEAFRRQRERMEGVRDSQPTEHACSRNTGASSLCLARERTLPRQGAVSEAEDGFSGLPPENGLTRSLLTSAERLP